MHDAVIVGAGPAGLSCAAELAARGVDTLVLDEGKDAGLRGRDSPTDILSGVGGAGLFSDGKHSFYPASSRLWRLPRASLLGGAFDATKALLRAHGVIGSEVATTSPATSPATPWAHKRYPSIYASLDQRRAMTADLAARLGSALETSSRVIDSRRVGDAIELTIERGGSTRRVRAAHLVVATGRLSPRWVRPWLERVGARYTFQRLELGVRIELPAYAQLFRRLDDVDPKLTLALSEGHRALTFCTCRDGEIVTGASRGVFAVSGRADGPATGRSSIGVLVRVVDPSVAAAIEPWLFRGGEPIVTALRDIVGRDRSEPALASVLGERGASLVKVALSRFSEALMASDEVDVAAVHAPCIEGVGMYPSSDHDLRVADSVRVAGDVTGLFRGIVSSMVSGRYAAGSILSELSAAD